MLFLFTILFLYKGRNDDRNEGWNDDQEWRSKKQKRKKEIKKTILYWFSAITFESSVHARKCIVDRDGLKPFERLK